MKLWLSLPKTLAATSGEPSRIPPELADNGDLEPDLQAPARVIGETHGDTAFTVPLFESFMLRIMPGNDWRD